MDGFNGILDTGLEEDLKLMKDKLVDGRVLLVDLKAFSIKMIKNDKDSPKIRQILLH